MADNSSFASHLVELRSRLLNSLIFIFITFIISYIFAEDIYNFLVEPYAEAVRGDQVSRRLIFTALHETFIAYIKVAFFTAIFFGSPVLLIQIYKFIAPGLYKNENRQYYLFDIYTNTFFIRRTISILFGDAFAIKFFLSFETLGSNLIFRYSLEAKVNEYLSLIMTYFCFWNKFSITNFIKSFGKNWCC